MAQKDETPVDTTTEQNQEATQGKGRKVSKNEKKFKKAMSRLGMKQVEGITRVTLKTLKNFILYIDRPDVMKSTGAEESYVIFGEAKFFDFTKNVANTELDKFKAPEAATVKEEAAENEEAAEGGEEAGDDDAGDIPDETINTLMEYTSCTRQQAIAALKQTGGDLVEAITLTS